MRIKFEATDATGKVHKRSSTSHVYSHCLVIHFAAHPPSKLWPKGISACSHAEWAASRALAERNQRGQRGDFFNNGAAHVTHPTVSENPTSSRA